MAEALDVGGLVRVDPVRFIQGELRHTSDRWAGRPFKLRAFQREFLNELFREARGRRVYSRALWGLPRKNGKSEIAAAVGTKMLVADGTYGAEVISVAGDRAQARIVFAAGKRMVEFSPRLSATLRIFRDAIEDPGTDSVWRVMSADAPLKHGLRPSAVIFDEVHVQPSRELWDVLESGFGGRAEPLLLGITTAGYDRASLLGDLVREGEEGKDPRFLYRWVGLPKDSEADYRDPKTWRLANPALSCRGSVPGPGPPRRYGSAPAGEPVSPAALEPMDDGSGRRVRGRRVGSRRGRARRFRRGPRSSSRSSPHVSATPSRSSAAPSRSRTSSRSGSGRKPSAWTPPTSPTSSAPSGPATASREFLCSEADWTWVLLMLAEEGLPVTKVPRSPQRLALQWSQFYDAVLERRLDPRPRRGARTSRRQPRV